MREWTPNWIEGLWVVLGAVAVGMALLWLREVWRRWRLGLVTVYDTEAGLKIVKGKMVGVLQPGRYATWPGTVEIERVDLREQTVAVSGQEMLTADSLSIRAGLLVTFWINDPARQRLATATPHSHLYQAAQIVLRQRIAAKPLDDVLKDRAALDTGFVEDLQPQAAAIGCTVTQARVLDVSLTGPAKQAFADLWKAQKEGLAALERARGEVASLRALANAARMLKGNPELMNLRVLQAASAKPGAPSPTIILGGAGGIVPVSKEAAPDAEAPVEPDNKS